MSKTSLHTRRIVVSALFLALALLFRTFRQDIPLMGESGLRISIHVIFSSMPSILFGPVYGAMVAGLTDMLGHFIRPSGAWLPQLTLTAVLAGFMRGWLWILLKKRSTSVMRAVLVSTGVLFIAVGGYNLYAFRADGITRDFYRHTDERRAAWEIGQTDEQGTWWEITTTQTEQPHGERRIYETVRIVSRSWSIEGLRVISESENDEGERVRRAEQGDLTFSGMRWVSRMAISRSFHTLGQTIPLTEFITFTTLLMMGSGGFLLFLILLDFLVRKILHKREPLPQTLALVLTLMLPAILMNTVNTIILRYTVMTSWQVLPFFVVWLPRIMQSIGTTTLNLFFVIILIGLCEKQPHIRALMRK
jgi:ECF transporter S component (folate family)